MNPADVPFTRLRMRVKGKKIPVLLPMLLVVLAILLVLLYKKREEEEKLRVANQSFNSPSEAPSKSINNYENANWPIDKTTSSQSLPKIPRDPSDLDPARDDGEAEKDTKKSFFDTKEGIKAIKEGEDDFKEATIKKWEKDAPKKISRELELVSSCVEITNHEKEIIRACLETYFAFKTKCFRDCFEGRHDDELGDLSCCKDKPASKRMAQLTSMRLNLLFNKKMKARKNELFDSLLTVISSEAVKRYRKIGMK
jgi:hypothetical protein